MNDLPKKPTSSLGGRKNPVSTGSRPAAPGGSGETQVDDKLPGKRNRLSEFLNSVSKDCEAHDDIDEVVLIVRSKSADGVLTYSTLGNDRMFQIFDHLMSCDPIFSLSDGED